MNLKRLLSFQTAQQQELKPNEREEILVEAVNLDEQTRSFLNSKPGKYLISRMEDDQRSALIALSKVEHWDTGQIKTLQDQYHFACKIQNYLAEILNQGYQARYELNPRQQEE